MQWHRAGFKAYWTWLSRHRAPVGRKRIGIELRDLIFRIIAENPTWGASRIHGELAMLGFTNFNEEVAATVKSLDIVPKRTSFRSPWQNGVGERWVGSCRRDLLDHVIVLNERHLKRLTREYVRYYHDDRTHLGLNKATPAGRKAAISPIAGRKVLSTPRLGGLHHRYDLAA